MSTVAGLHICIHFAEMQYISNCYIQCFYEALFRNCMLYTCIFPIRVMFFTVYMYGYVVHLQVAYYYLVIMLPRVCVKPTWRRENYLSHIHGQIMHAIR